MGPRAASRIVSRTMDLTEMPRAGQCGVYLGDLHEVEERRVERVWYALAPEGVKTERYGKKEETVKKRSAGSRRSKGSKKQRRSSTIDEEEVTVKKGPNLGRVEFALRWIHNPELVVMLPEQITRDEVHPEEAANSSVDHFGAVSEPAGDGHWSVWWNSRSLLCHKSGR